MRATAAILDVTHRLWLVGGMPPAIEVPPGVRPLAALHDAAPRELGLELLHPLGMQADGGGATFLFLVHASAPAARADGAFVPLRRWALDETLAPMWRLYVDAMLGGWEPPTRELDVCYFGNEPELAAKLGHLIVKGVKRGTTGLVAAAKLEGWSIPSVGTITIVTDGYGIPLCAIRTERSDRGRFADATEEIAQAEGEGDRSLAEWRELHRRYFEAQSARHGIPFGDDALMFYEYFRVVRVLGRDIAPGAR
jgi:uncharacterized protein YhfF